MADEKNTQRLLEQRNGLRKPAFVVKESHFKANVKKRWRLPRGKHSPVRQYHKGRVAMPTPGYGAPKAVYGLTKDGKNPIYVENLNDLNSVDAQKDIVVIASNVGLKKRISILKVCKEQELSVFAASDLRKEISKRDRQFADSKKITSDRRKEKESKAKKASDKKKEDKKAAKKEKEEKKVEVADKKSEESVKKEVPKAEKTEEKKEVKAKEVQGNKVSGTRKVNQE